MGKSYVLLAGTQSIAELLYGSFKVTIMPSLFEPVPIGSNAAEHACAISISPRILKDK